MMRWIAFGFSLPERLLRALASVLGGIALLLVGVIIPAAIKGTTLYRILIGDGLRFIVERIAGIPAVEAAALPADYQRRKLVGGAIESLGLIAVQFSPLWVFAIAGDAAAGSQVYIRRLVDHLRQQGVLDDDVTVEGLTDLLEALQGASRTTAGLIDMPPLTRLEIDQLAQDLKASYEKVFRGTGQLLSRLDRLWAQMNEVAASPVLSLEQLALFMSVETRNWLRKGPGTARAIGATGLELFGEQVLDGYQRTLDELKRQGVAAYVKVQLLPYLSAAQAQFKASELSWTERRLLGRSTRLDAGDWPQS